MIQALSLTEPGLVSVYRRVPLGLPDASGKCTAASVNVPVMRTERRPAPRQPYAVRVVARGESLCRAEAWVNRPRTATADRASPCPVFDTRVNRLRLGLQRQGQEARRRPRGTPPRSRHRTCARQRRRQAGRAWSLEMQEDLARRQGGEDQGGRRERPALRGAGLRRGVWSRGGGAFGRGVAPCRSSGCLPDSACVLETSIPPSLSPPARPIPAPVPARPGHERSDPASTCCPWTSVLLAITGFIASNIRGLFGLTGRPPDAEYADDMRRRTFVRTG